ncbi:P-loop containing nucleoside triphosphatehydrolases superfamily protein [Striga asiatica]|uniref:P-loop containing nucleoside triphosphatehydrolases superfamily protein n=1 Tax=Striga asiatica TaxID=4170 RepID=A0A5A7QNC0_STRAF|nr:P-loop containing nucleoside triphosphatehydrolases superfamily protein [Striga asiatica]
MSEPCTKHQENKGQPSHNKIHGLGPPLPKLPIGLASIPIPDPPRDSSRPTSGQPRPDLTPHTPTQDPAITTGLGPEVSVSPTCTPEDRRKRGDRASLLTLGRLTTTDGKQPEPLPTLIRHHQPTHPHHRRGRKTPSRTATKDRRRPSAKPPLAIDGAKCAETPQNRGGGVQPRVIRRQERRLFAREGEESIETTKDERRFRDKDNYNSRNSDNVQEEEEEEEADKEQCSPVSVLDNTPYEDDEEHENRDTDDYMMKCSYENVQRARQQLLYRLQRFEKLAELDTTELERDVLQGSDDEDGDEQLPMYEKQSTVENILTQVFDQSNLGYNSRNVSPDMKRLVHDLIVEENGEVAFAENNEVLISRICRILDSWREVEPNTIDMMVGFDFKGEFGRWTKFDEQLGDVSTEIELAIYGLLVEEISDELVNMDGKCLQF